ncbi:helix-hairpin-helix domain-containing protein [Carboxylicivirga sp. M1479]|uniref:helix-hairpin-helix domain-containing protein n=1 Tax=Carboxylicivirga sp. M1479 TaxID=2594476 RepID=UPI00163DDD2C|nr:helix-hairpin-helix domain-containing protein [Carboxylicivirga sp. M1479]
MKHYILVIMCLLFALCGMTQELDDLNKRITDMLETMADEQIRSMDYDELINDLIDLNQNPINLNTASKNDLERLFFLTDFQIENILFYRYENGDLYSVYELQAVEKLDSATIQYMLPFVCVRQPEEKRKMRVYGNVLARVQSTFQTPEGYLSDNDSTAPNYLGSKEKWLTRGRVYFGDKAELGFTLEKDQGEQAFPKTFPAADFNSAFVRINQPIKLIDNWIIGDYRLSFGQGLGVWTDMAFSKSTETVQLRRRAKGSNVYTSVNESSFLRGSALKLQHNKWSATPFYSYKKRDASMVNDTMSSLGISSLQETGYHRTATELQNKHTVSEAVYGLQSAYQHHYFHMDAGYVNWHLNTHINEKEHLKDKYKLAGSTQETYWLSHTIFLNRLTIFGEVAMQNAEEFGVYQGLTYQSNNDVNISLAYRKYSKAYTSILSNPFSESSTRGGESGVFASISFKPGRRWLAKAFIDIFSYEWLRYNVYRPSDGFEIFAQLNYEINQQSNSYIRYKSTIKERNGSELTNNYQINNYQKDNFRLFYAYQPDDKWRFQTQMEHAIYKEEKMRSYAWMVFQDVRVKPTHWLALSVRYVLFDIDDYNSRIYSYEPDVLYAFTVPAYMNKGTRVLFNFNVKPSSRLRIWARLAHTNYSNLEEIGSGNQLIKGSVISDWKLQLQYRF